MLAGIELGGTKINIAIGTREGEIIEKIQFPTGNPMEGVRKILDYLRDKDIEALGIGSFGPVGVNKERDNYGHILKTPKLDWADFNLLGELEKEIKVPIVFDTDVNAAILAEVKWGAAKGLSSAVYVTVGTGIGGGAYIDGKLIHGLMHTEMGHFYPKIHPADRDFPGVCPYHGTCFEGLASGPSIEKRYKQKAHNLDENHQAWELEAHYLAHHALSITMMYSPEIIIYGGGVMKQKHLFPKIHREFEKLLAGYIKLAPLVDDIDKYIVFPDLGDFAGLYGCLALATLV